MHPNPSPRPGTKLYQHDVVQKLSSPDWLGVVLRCWHDPEEIPPDAAYIDPLMRPLNYREVGVSFSWPGGDRQILLESDLRLVDRVFQPGDYCKRSIEDLRSGVVTRATVKGRVAHSISSDFVEGWRISEDLEDRTDPGIGDYIAYDDWIGQIIEVFDESLVQIAAGQLVRVPELGSRLNVGDSGNNILPRTDTSIQNWFGLFPTTNSEDTKDTVVAVKHSAFAVAWLALNQSLDPAVAANKKRPKRFWYGTDVGDLLFIRGKADLEMRLGDRVYLKDTGGVEPTKHGQEGDVTGIVQVNTFLVAETQSVLEVLWQDGIRESVKSTDLIPYLSPDEYDCWPGDHVVLKTEGSRRSAIVQSVNANQRTSFLLFPDTGSVELASALELDPHGSSDLDAAIPQMATEAFGVRRGDFVFIHRPGTTNGLKSPKVPRIGELEAWIRDHAFSEHEVPSWRKELHEIGTNIAARRNSEGWEEGKVQRPTKGDGKLLWCGEVTGLNLDGTVEVTHPDWTVASYPLDRLTRLYDGLEQLEDGMWDDDEGSDGYQSMDEDGEEAWAMEQDGVWRAEKMSDEWEDINDNPLNEPEMLDLSDLITDQYRVDDDGDSLAMQPTDGPDISAASFGAAPPALDAVPAEIYLDESNEWKRFDIRPSAPPDHAFYSSPPAQLSKAFLGRLQREYRVLSTSLPEAILVRAYEDRADLLRTLIIGPENTPYEYAPFVIDWMLDSNFPHSPPVAHFLSWTNGNGRVNPNLYEEGKVCLSILGTWSGDKNETWSASRSSLMQAFVSIQGLVLVKEPWFCEPAFEKLRGTEEGIVNSRLYNEKAYVLSRGFARRALEIPLGGLESEINLFYHKNGYLSKIIQDARALIQKSRDQPETLEEDHDIAVPRLTAGGIIALERTLNKLQGLLRPSPSG